MKIDEKIEEYLNEKKSLTENDWRELLTKQYTDTNKYSGGNLSKSDIDDAVEVAIDLLKKKNKI